MSWDDIIDDALEVVRDQFGDTVLYRRDENAPPFEICAVFDRESVLEKSDYQGMEPLETSVSDFEPILFIREADIDFKPDQGDEVCVKGTWYTVWDVARDGHGGIDLVLQKG